MSPSLLVHRPRSAPSIITISMWGIAGILLVSAMYPHQSHALSQSVRAEQAPALFYSETGGPAMLGYTASMAVRFEPDAIYYRAQTGSLEMRLIGARAVAPVGLSEAGRLNVLRGSNPAAWRYGAPLYQKVIYRDAYPGIDLVYGGSLHTIKSEYIVAPNADPSQIRFRFGDSVTARVLNGSLTVKTNGAVFRESAPECYQDGAHGKTRVQASYHVFDDGTVGFSLGSYDVMRTLIIDPEVTFSTFWGGSLHDALTGVAAGDDGSMYVCGWSESADVPVLNASQPAWRGSTDAFVMKLSASNTIVYATYLGGSGQDQANAIEIDAAGNAYVAGWTASADFPRAGAFQQGLSGSRDAFVTKLSPAGGIVFSTYLGGSGADAANAIRVDASGSAYVAGQTMSSDFPATNGFQQRFGGVEDAFITKLSPAGNTLVYSTYLGGSGSDQAYGLAVLNGEAYVTGATNSIDFPIMNALQSRNQGGQDAFVTKIGISGSALAYSTYLGGSGGSPSAPETGRAIAVTASGEVVIVGMTNSPNFPLAAPLKTALQGLGADAFVTKLGATGSNLTFSTYLGGAAEDAAQSVAIAPDQTIYITGETMSADFPVVNATQSVKSGIRNAFILRIAADLRSIKWSSFLGGGGSDSAAAIALDASGSPVVAGVATSWDFPLRNAIQSYNASSYGGFVTRFADAVLWGGVYRAGHWIPNSSASPDVWFGNPGDIPVLGDWNHSGKLKIGVYRSNGQWFVDYNGNYQWDGPSIDRQTGFGMPGDIPVVGDWDGSGWLRIGVYRNGQWLVDWNGNFAWDGEPVDRSFWFGLPGDIPVVGDWDGTGRLRIGVYRQGQWFVDINGNKGWDGAGIDASFWYGIGGQLPVIGDWDGSGRRRIGVFDRGTWYVDYNASRSWDGIPVDRIFYFGAAGDIPIAGRW
jgi:Beta-propeller repeat